MNLATAIRRIKRFKPRTFEDFGKAGIPFGKNLGGGVFREAYQIKDLPLVVKFPIEDDGIDHSRDEMRKIKKFSKFKFLRKYLPKVYYYDRQSGVIVMKFYEDFEDCGDACDAVGTLAGELIKRLTGVSMVDIHSENVRVRDTYKPPRLVFCDLGY